MRSTISAAGPTRSAALEALVALATLATLAACGSSARVPDAGPTLAALPSCTGTASAAFAEALAAGPAAGSEDYAIASPAQLEAWAQSLEAIIDGRGTDALSHATAAGYELCRRGGADDTVIQWIPTDRGGRALIAFRPGNARALVVGAPHPRFESRTLDQAIVLFQDLGARAMVVSGTHRCANSAASGCDGTTGVCGVAGQPYRDSDMAHVDGSLYHLAHLQLVARYPELWALSLHGMGGDGASISDGTTRATTADAPVAAFAAALRAEFSGERVTTCNDYPDAIVETRLCGTTNAQGRAWNASADACSSAATRASERFLHLEQSVTLRSQPQAVARALDATLPL